MKDFNEAVLKLTVNVDVAEAYKKAIEAENSPSGLRDHWDGNYAYVVIGDKYEAITVDAPAYFEEMKELNFGVNWDPKNFTSTKLIEKDAVELTIQLLSHTLPNLKQTVDWYEKMGCTVIRVTY